MIKPPRTLNVITAPRVTVLDHSGMDLAAVFSPEEIATMQAQGRYCGTPLENKIEFMGRLCYDSHAAGRPTADYFANIIASRHSSVAEHATISLLFQGISRGLTHELVRQRVGVSYSQRSTRYCDEGTAGYVMPVEDDDSIETASAYFGNIREVYKHQYGKALARLGDRKRARGVARSWLPNGTETEIGVTFNLVSLFHFLAIRGSRHAEREIVRLAIATLEATRHLAPHFFGCIQTETVDGVTFIVPSSVPFEGR